MYKLLSIVSTTENPLNELTFRDFINQKTPLLLHHFNKNKIIINMRIQLS